MSAPSIPVTLPPLPSFPSLFTQPTSFSTGQQSVLQSFANPITGVSASVISSGAQDLFNTEQTLLSNNSTLNQFVSNLLNLSITPLSSTSVANLQNILTNPQTFITSVFSSTPINGTQSPQAFIQALISNPSGISQILLDWINTPALVGFLESLFPNTTTIGGSNVTSQQLIVSLFGSSSTTLGNAFTSVVKWAMTSPFVSVFESLVSSSAPWSTANPPGAPPTSPTTLISDLFTNPIKVPTDILNLVNVSNLSGASSLSFVNSAVGLGDWLRGTIFGILNIFNIDSATFLGTPVPANNPSGNPNRIQANFHTTSFGGTDWVGINSATGFYWPSITPPGISFPGGSGSSNNAGTGLPGTIGFIASALTAAAGGFDYVMTNDIATLNVPDAINHLVSDGYLMLKAFIALVGMVTEIFTALINPFGIIQNTGTGVLGTGVPTNSSQFLTMFNGGQGIRNGMFPLVGATDNTW